MALSETPNCSPKPEILNLKKKKKKKKYKKKKLKTNRVDNLDDSTQLQQASTPRKRTKSPGIRIRGGRIFDSENGKTCHQCRQKTMDLVAICKNSRSDKPCPIMFCLKCLFNRYGENAEEANLLDDWKCPKCRGICNCSFCRKKSGYQPTGIMVHTAKKDGFTSVLEMLNVNGPESCISRKRRKENSYDVKDDSIPLISLMSLSNSKKIKERKRKNLGNGDNTQSKKRRKKTHLSGDIDLNVKVKEEDEITEKTDGGEIINKIQQSKLKKLAQAKKYVYLQDNGTQSKERTNNAHWSGEFDLNIAVKEEEMRNERVDAGEIRPMIRKNKLKKLARVKKFLDVLDNRNQSKEWTKKAHPRSGIDLNHTVKEEEEIYERLYGGEKMPKIRQYKLKKLARAKKCLDMRDSGVHCTGEPYFPTASTNSTENEEDKINEIACATLDPIETQQKIAYSRDFQICISEESAKLIKIEEETGEKHLPLPDCCKNGGKGNLGDKAKPITDYKLKTESDADISLPRGINLTTVADIELPAEDVLQFLEFCNDFGEELLSKEAPDVPVLEPPPVVPLEMLASLCNFVHMIS